MKYLLVLVLLAGFVSGVSLEDAKDALVNATLDVEQAKKEGLPHESLVDALSMMVDSLSGKDLRRLRETALALNESDESRALALRYFEMIEESERTGLRPGQNFTFVVQTARWIAERKELAFEARELLSAVEEDVLSADPGLNLSTVNFLLLSARSAYESERFERVPELVNETRFALEQAQVAAARERALVALARRTVVGFVEQNWVGVLVFLAVFAVLAVVAFFELRVVYALRRIVAAKRELKVAHEMLVGAQRDYYGGNIGRATYNSRLDQQRERSRTLQAELNGWVALHDEYKKKSFLARFKQV